MPDREKVKYHLDKIDQICASFDYVTHRRIQEELFEVLNLLKEQEAEIRQLRLALDIAKGTCKGIVMEGR